MVAVHEGDTVAFKKGKWSKEEDEKLRAAVEEYGIQNWVAIEKFSGLARPSKNCRLRWFNHLRPNLKKCPFTQEEEETILLLHHKYGNSWSLIASELPGRSDNEIKNYWNKRAKKCKKRHLPPYPPQTQEEQSLTNSPTINNQNHVFDETKNRDEDGLEDNLLPTNYTSQTHPPISIHSPELQRCTVLNVKNTSSHAQGSSITASIDSPQALISLTSKLQMSRPNPSPDIAKQTNAHALHQDDVVYKEFKPLRKPPILASVKGGFRGFSVDTSQLPPQGDSVSATTSAIENASELLPTDSSPKLHRLWPMESPQPQPKLESSPQLAKQDFARTSSINSQVSFSAVPLKSPTSHSPLKLRLLTTVPSDPGFQPEILRSDSTVQSNSTTAAPSLFPPQLKPSSSSHLDLPTILPVAFDTNSCIPEIVVFDTNSCIPYFLAPLDSALPIKAELPSIPFSTSTINETNSCIPEMPTDSNKEILDALKEAQNRVQYLKKRLSELKSPNKNFGESRIKDFTSPTNSKAKHTLKRTFRREEESKRNSKTGVLLDRSVKIDKILCKLHKEVSSRKRKYEHEESTRTEELKRTENPETKAPSGHCFRRKKHSLSDCSASKKSTDFPDQRYLIDLVDHLHNQNTNACSKTDSWDGKTRYVQDFSAECLQEFSIAEGSLCESMEISQENLLMEGLLSQRSEIECPLDTQDPMPRVSALGQIYRQYEDTVSTLAKDNSKLSYNEGGYFCHTFGQEFSDGMEREFTKQETLMDSNFTETSQFCESSLLLHQFPEANILDSNLVASKPFSKPRLLGSEQSYLTSPSSLKTEGISAETWKQDPSLNQNSNEELLVDNFWSEWPIVSQKLEHLTNVFNSASTSSGPTYLRELNNINGGHTVLLKQQEEHNHVDTMPEELSSLLEFFPTTIHTPAWYNNGEAFHRGEDYKLNNTHVGINEG